MCSSGHPSSGQDPPHQSDKYCNCTVRSVEEILATGQAEPEQESDLPDSFNQRSRGSEWKAFLEAILEEEGIMMMEEVREGEQPNDMIARNEEELKISSVRTLIEMGAHDSAWCHSVVMECMIQ